MMMRPLLLIRQTCQSQGRPTRVPSGRDHPLLRKHGLQRTTVQHHKRHLSQNRACTSWDEWEQCEESRKEPEYKEMCYLTFALVMELEQSIFEKCSFDQPLISHPSPLWGSDKPSLGSKSTYSKMTHWLQQSQSNINHFWKKDMALVKTLRQYHFASNVLEGRTQWKFQKSQILHCMLDVIAVHMEDMKRCLDFHDLTPVDQNFRHCDPNLHCLKAVMVKEVTHLTMILMLDKDHTHYSDAFRNIFKGDALCKKHFPEGPDGIKMRKGGATHTVVCCFCPYACVINDYAYHHLVATHLNIQWDCGICFGFMNGYLSKIREHVQSHQKKSSREQSHSSHKKDEDEGSGSSSDGISSDEEGSIGKYQDGEDDGKWSSSDSNEISPDASDPDLD